MSSQMIGLSRVAYAALATAVTVPLLAIGQSAQARPADAEATEVAGNLRHTATATAQAWTAGRRAFGSTATTAQAIEAYWTPERMRTARPVEESAGYRSALARAEQAGTLAAPEAPAAARSLTVAPSEGALGTPPALMATAVDPNYSYWHPTARTSGKVFFTLNNLNYQCSATIVNSTGQNTVWTAGHCVHSGATGVWASNWQFVPSYDQDLANPRPYGTWTATALWTRTAWATSSDMREDMAVAIMGTLNGQHIVGYLGGQGLTANQGFTVAYNAFGYPSETPFTGGRLQRCAATSGQESAQTIYISCNMNRGASGGGWLASWDGNWGYLNGVFSRANSVPTATMNMSPYFDDTAVDLYNSTASL